MPLRCDDCGRFITKAKSWAYIYDLVGMCLDHEHSRCAKCHDESKAKESGKGFVLLRDGKVDHLTAADDLKILARLRPDDVKDSCRRGRD